MDKSYAFFLRPVDRKKVRLFIDGKFDIPTVRWYVKKKVLRRFELPNLEKWFHLYIIAQSSGSSIKNKNVAFYFRLLHDDFIVWKFFIDDR